MRWLTRRPPRAAAIGRHVDLSAALDDGLAALSRTTDPAGRAGLLFRLSEWFAELASLQVPIFGVRARPTALTFIDNANLARIVADTEVARARRAPRRRGRPDLEQRAGALLDQLADPDVGDSTRADIYAVLQAVTRPVWTGTDPVPLLGILQEWHAARAATPGYWV